MNVCRLTNLKKPYDVILLHCGHVYHPEDFTLLLNKNENSDTNGNDGGQFSVSQNVCS